MVATGAEAASAAGLTEYSIAGRAGAPSNAIFTRRRNCSSNAASGAPAAVALPCRSREFFEQRRGIRDDLDVVRAAFVKEHRHARSADLMRACPRRSRADEPTHPQSGLACHHLLPAIGGSHLKRERGPVAHPVGVGARRRGNIWTAFTSHIAFRPQSKAHAAGVVGSGRHASRKDSGG